MKLNRIKITNFLGIAHLDIAIEKPILLISGPNACGKSSVAHALRFVLDDDLVRVKHKKNIKEMVRVGAKSGTVSIYIDGIEHTRSAATGNFTSTLPEVPAALTYCLSPGAFISLHPQDRRGFLFDLMGINTSPGGILMMLEDRGHNTDTTIKYIAYRLEEGFPAAHNEAQLLARGHKGEWRGITGEDWGSIKGDAWTCGAPEIYPGEIDGLNRDIESLDHAISVLQTRHGMLIERKRRSDIDRERMVKTKAIADELEARQAARLKLQTEIDALIHEQSQLRDQLEAARRGLVIETHASQGIFFDCPACGSHLNYSRGECKVGEPTAVDIAAEIESSKAHVAELEIALDNIGSRKHVAARLLVDAINAVGHAEAATDSLAHLQQEIEVADDDPRLDEQITALKIKRADAQEELDRTQAAIRAHYEAVGKTEEAQDVHEKILAMTALAADLAPDGLPAELLAASMGKLNDRLLRSSTVSGWPPVMISTDEIWIHARAWDLASASEQWRATAMIGEAISHLSGIGILVLDGLDILEPALRAKALALLMQIAPEHQNIIVMATLKQPPQGLPADIQSVWLGEEKSIQLSAAS